MAFESIVDFLDPVDLALILEDGDLKEGQIGKSIEIFQDEFPDLTHADIVIATCDELRGDGQLGTASPETDAIRTLFTLQLAQANPTGRYWKN